MLVNEGTSRAALTDTVRQEKARAVRLAVRLSGALLVLHGLAHALWGLQSVNRAVGWVSTEPTDGSNLLLWLATLLWSFAMGGFLLGGFGLLGARWVHRYWLPIVMAATAASVILLLGFRPPMLFPGLVLDMAMLAGMWRWGPRRRATLDIGPRAQPTTIRRLAGGLLSAAAVAFSVALILLVLLRPFHMQWGSTDDELHAVLPGDELVPEPVAYAVQHAITIRAPADSVWPWLAQIGQDRGGFYSHTTLENLFGLRITNADRIHQEWQGIAEGDTIYAAPDGWLGLPKRWGWRITRLEPGRALFLEGWGQLVLVPVDSVTTRFVIRTRRGGGAASRGFVLALGALWIELPQFIMERGMLLGMKERAERDPGIMTSETRAESDSTARLRP